MASEAIRVIPCSKVKKYVFSSHPCFSQNDVGPSNLVGKIQEMSLYQYVFNKGNSNNLLVSSCYQPFSLSSHLDVFTWHLPLKKRETSNGQTPPHPWRPRRGVVHVASQVSTERHAVRSLRGHPKARGASRVTRRRIR